MNAQGGRYSNALNASVSRDHTEISRLLLDKGADVNAQAQSGYGDPLQAAASIGHTDIARILLDKGADVNSQGGTYGNALQAASIGSLDDLDHYIDESHRLKLQKRAGEDAQRHDGNALQAASGGHTDMVKLLLDKGADVNLQGGYYGNALQSASHKGNLEIVKSLLDKGADVNAQGGHHGTAL